MKIRIIGVPKQEEIEELERKRLLKKAERHMEFSEKYAENAKKALEELEELYEEERSLRQKTKWYAKMGVPFAIIFALFGMLAGHAAAAATTYRFSAPSSVMAAIGAGTIQTIISLFFAFMFFMIGRDFIISVKEKNKKKLSRLDDIIVSKEIEAINAERGEKYYKELAMKELLK